MLGLTILRRQIGESEALGDSLRVPNEVQEAIAMDAVLKAGIGQGVAAMHYAQVQMAKAMNALEVARAQGGDSVGAAKAGTVPSIRDDDAPELFLFPKSKFYGSAHNAWGVSLGYYQPGLLLYVVLGFLNLREIENAEAVRDWAVQWEAWISAKLTEVIDGFPPPFSAPDPT